MSHISQTSSTVSVLHIDDDLAFLELVRDYLPTMDNSIKVESVDDPQRALDLAETKNYDVIVSDYQMPKIDGLSLIKMLRQRSIMTPLIILTGKGREDVVIEVGSGIYGFEYETIMASIPEE